jgi:hypothetical protein
MPSRSEFDAQALRPWLGNLALIDIDQAGHAHFRLCGTNLLGRFGGEFTNRPVDELEATIKLSIRNYIEGVRRTCAPRSGKHVQIIDGTATTFLELALPLSNAHPDVDTILFASLPAIVPVP